jgi:predicted TIM-barrel fold metal-dependent hydrolase
VRYSRHLRPAAINLVRQIAAWLADNQDRLVIDADTHITDLDSLTGPRRERFASSPTYYHGRPISVEDLVREMDLAAVDMALAWQNPAATAYTSDPDENAELLLAANQYVFDSAVRCPGRIVPAGWTDPKACGVSNALRIVDVCVGEFGFVVVKMNPAQNGYAIDGPEAVAIADRIIELGAVPAFHFGADTPFTPADGLERIASRYGERPVLAVHMGGGGAGYVQAEGLYHEARSLGLRRPNLRFALSAKRDTHIESDLIAYLCAGEPYRRNLFCASDAPYGRIAWNFGGFRGMLKSLMDGAQSRLLTPQAAQGFLGGNFARFACEAYRRLLDVHEAASPVCR